MIGAPFWVAVGGPVSGATLVYASAQSLVAYKDDLQPHCNNWLRAYRVLVSPEVLDRSLWWSC